MRDYLWASPVGRIRIIEKGLLTRAELGQVLEASSLETALAALRDSYYGPYVSKLDNPELFETALQEAIKNAHNDMMRLAPEPLILAAYRARYDFHNLKVLLKAKLLAVEAEEGAFSGLGNLDEGAFRAVLDATQQGDAVPAPQEQEPDPLAVSIHKVSLEIARVYRTIIESAAVSELSPFEVDSYIDKSYYAWADTIYRKHGYEALVEFLKSEIDILNLKIAFRAKRLGIPGYDFGKIMLSGGSISPVAVAEAYIQGPHSLYRVYKGTELDRLAKRGISLLEKKEPLTLWEKECDNAIVRIMREAGTISLGPEPVFGYVFGREIEVKNLRIILSGKQAFVPENEISERLRESYA